MNYWSHSKWLKIILKNIPHSSWIYKFLDNEKKIIYIWKSVNLFSRVNSYFNGTSKLNFAKQEMIWKVYDIDLIVTNNETEALMLESTMIKKHQPKYNILLKDWKDHTYIKITSEKIPRIIKTRTKNSSGTYFWPYLSTQYVNNLLKIAKKVFWYRSCKLIFIEEWEKLKIKSKNIKIPCMDYYIGRCSWPCLLEKKYINQYNKDIQDIKKFLKWDYKGILKDLEIRMLNAAKKQNFERAQSIKMDIESLHSLSNNQIVRNWVEWDCDVLNYIEKYWKIYLWKIEIIESKIRGFYAYEIENKLEEPIEEIFTQYILRNYFWKQKPKRKSLIILDEKIEINLKNNYYVNIQYSKKWSKSELIKLCYKNLYEYSYKKHLASLSTKNFTKQNMKFLLEILWYSYWTKEIIFECNDISHISGNHSVASRSVIENWKLNKNKYRKFKIKSLDNQKIDDFASMREVMERRCLELKEHNNYPDLLIIDGGKWQLSAVMEVLKKHAIKIQIVWLAKKEEELFLPEKQKSIQLKKGSAELRMIQKIRDEAHRFAITFNRDSRIKAMKKNILEWISGIGPKTRKKLINKYGNIENLKWTNKEELSKIVSKNIIESLDDHWLL